MSTYRRLLYLPIKDGSVCQGPSLNKGFNKIDQKVKRAVCTSRSAGRLILHLFSSEPQAESWNFWPFSSPGNKGFELTPGEHANSKNLWFLRWKACLLTLLQRRFFLRAFPASLLLCLDADLNPQECPLAPEGVSTVPTPSQPRAGIGFWPSRDSPVLRAFLVHSVGKLECCFEKWLFMQWKPLWLSWVS